MEHLVENVDFKNKKVLVKNIKTNETFEENYDKLVISSGSKPINLNFESLRNNQPENLIDIKWFEDSDVIKNKLNNDEIKNVTVVGGGYIGVELTEAIRNKGKQVRVIDSSKELLSNFYDSEFSEIAKEEMIKNEVELSLNSKVIDFEFKNDLITKVKTDNGDFETDLVILSIGAKSNTSFLKNDELKMTNDGSIIVNSKQETSIDDVYAIGDCSAIKDSITNEFVSIKSASNAIRSGAVAALNIANVPNSFFNPVSGSNALNLFRIKMYSTGLSESRAKKLGLDVMSSVYDENKKTSFESGKGRVLISIVYLKDTRVIIGAQLLSRGQDISTWLHIFTSLITNKTTVDELKFMDFFINFNSPINYINEVALKAK